MCQYSLLPGVTTKRYCRRLGRRLIVASIHVLQLKFVMSVIFIYVDRSAPSDGSWIWGHFYNHRVGSSIGSSCGHQLRQLYLHRQRRVVTRHLNMRKLSKLRKIALMIATHVNGNFLWQGEMWNWSRHDIVYSLYAARWTIGWNFFSLYSHFAVRRLLMSRMCRFLFRTLRYMWFNMFSKVILAVKSFSALGTNLK